MRLKISSPAQSENSLLIQPKNDTVPRIPPSLDQTIDALFAYKPARVSKKKTAQKKRSMKRKSPKP